mgnify:FL=1
MVIWLIGLSGCGKTTLAEEVVRLARESRHPTVLLDGDKIRELFQDDLDHSLEGRKCNADRICRLSQFLEQQGINVVCAILSIFPESRNWCRENLINYYEVFIDSPIKDLIRRDSKGLYRQFNEGKIRNVAGLDLEFIRPEMPDLLIKNDSTLDDFLLNASLIFQQLNNQVK